MSRRVYPVLMCQKAPSTRRCIKTSALRTVAEASQDVRKHPAPEGALRLRVGSEVAFDGYVRKHPAPEGALRHTLQPD